MRTTTSPPSTRDWSLSHATTSRREFAANYSLQRVGVHRALAQPGSPAYRSGTRNCCKLAGQGTGFRRCVGHVFSDPHDRALPHVLVLSTLYPKSPQETVNVVEFYYPEEIALFEREFVEAQRAAYMETAVEDDEIGERMDAGRLALMKRGTNEAGPTSRRWKTACSISMNGIARWSAIRSKPCRAQGARPFRRANGPTGQARRTAWFATSTTIRPKSRKRCPRPRWYPGFRSETQPDQCSENDGRVLQRGIEQRRTLTKGTRHRQLTDET